MSNYLFSVQNCPAPDFVHNNRNNIDIKFPSNGFNPYITVADDVSSLGFLTLLLQYRVFIKYYAFFEDFDRVQKNDNILRNKTIELRSIESLHRLLQ